MQRVLLFILLFTVSSISISCKQGSGNFKSKNGGKYLTNESSLLPVTKVVDGDTFWADDGNGKGVKIRLIGVDAPESRNSFKKVKGYYGKESKVYLTNLLKGKRVRLEYDIDILDQYTRTLAYVYLEEGTFVNAELVKNGYAMVMTVPPNIKYAEEFVRLQNEARENNRGLWNDTVESN